MSFAHRLFRSSSVLLSLLVAGAAAGCGSSSATTGPELSSGAAGHSVGDGSAGDGGALSASGAAGSLSDAAGGSSQVGFPNAAAPPAPPGVYLTSESVTSSGVSPCSTKPLGDVLAIIRAANPTLADIRTIYNPATATTDGSFIYAYDVGVLGFDIVFKRGLGDCSAGCTENDYQYFTTGASCLPTRVGHYHAGWGTGTCLTVDGTPMWTHPTPPDPLTVCGADNSPRDLRGRYSVSASGQRTPCAAGAVANAVGGTLQLTIEQNARDFATGFVTFSSTGDPLVDGVRLPARFQRWRFDAALMSNTPSSCPQQASVTARYDFEGYQPGGIDALVSGGDGCGACKGSTSVVLGAASAHY